MWPGCFVAQLKVDTRRVWTASRLSLSSTAVPPWPLPCRPAVLAGCGACGCHHVAPVPAACRDGPAALSRAAGRLTAAALLRLCLLSKHRESARNFRCPLYVSQRGLLLRYVLTYPSQQEQSIYCSNLAIPMYDCRDNEPDCRSQTKSPGLRAARADF